MIAELVLRGHEPPEIPTEPATDPPPHAKFAMRRSIDPTRGQDRRRPADMRVFTSWRKHPLSETPHDFSKMVLTSQDQR